jgi:hypothetical protein
MRAYAAFIYAFLYLPILVIVAFSFNAGRYAMDGLAGIFLGNHATSDLYRNSLRPRSMEFKFRSGMWHWRRVRSRLQAPVHLSSETPIVLIAEGIFGENRRLLESDGAG